MTDSEKKALIEKDILKSDEPVKEGPGWIYHGTVAFLVVVIVVITVSVLLASGHLGPRSNTPITARDNTFKSVNRHSAGMANHPSAVNPDNSANSIGSGGSGGGEHDLSPQRLTYTTAAGGTVTGGLVEEADSNASPAGQPAEDRAPDQFFPRMDDGLFFDGPGMGDTTPAEAPKEKVSETLPQVAASPPRVRPHTVSEAIKQAKADMESEQDDVDPAAKSTGKQASSPSSSAAAVAVASKKTATASSSNNVNHNKAVHKEKPVAKTADNFALGRPDDGLFFDDPRAYEDHGILGKLLNKKPQQQQQQHDDVKPSKTEDNKKSEDSKKSEESKKSDDSKKVESKPTGAKQQEDVAKVDSKASGAAKAEDSKATKQEDGKQKAATVTAAGESHDQQQQAQRDGEEDANTSVHHKVNIEVDTEEPATYKGPEGAGLLASAPRAASKSAADQPAARQVTNHLTRRNIAAAMRNTFQNLHRVSNPREIKTLQSLHPRSVDAAEEAQRKQDSMNDVDSQLDHALEKLDTNALLASTSEHHAEHDDSDDEADDEDDDDTTTAAHDTTTVDSMRMRSKRGGPRFSKLANQWVNEVVASGATNPQQPADGSVTAHSPAVATARERAETDAFSQLVGGAPTQHNAADDVDAFFD